MSTPTKKTTKRKSPAKPKQQFVGREEFDAFRENNEKTQSEILSLVRDIATGKAEVKTDATVTDAGAAPIVQTPPPASAVEAAKPGEPSYLFPQYQKVFEKYFDPEDGFTARLVFPEVDEKTGVEAGGINFTIFVPLKFSNTDDGYRKMYKQDLRTRALQPHNIAKGIEDYCKAVANNLKYNRHIKTK